MAKTLRTTIGALLVAGLAASAGAQTAAKAFEGEELLPPGAKAGECYARVFVPATYKTVTETVLKSEASERVEVMPAQYQWVEEQVMVKGPSQRLEVFPATYGWVEEQVLVKEATTQVKEIPAAYKTVTEQVVDRPAHTVWKKGRGPMERVDYGTGEIMCLVEVPATYKTVTKRMLVKPAETQEVTIPAEYKTVRKRVMKTPPTTRVVEIPAEYTTVKVRKLVSPPQTKKVPIPAQYQEVTRQVKVTEGAMEWQPILCQTNVTPEIVRSIQQALSKAGHDPGPIDGQLGARTMSAVQSYQRAKGLPAGNLTYDTLRSLGVKLASIAPSST